MLLLWLTQKMVELEGAFEVIESNCFEYVEDSELIDVTRLWSCGF